MIYNNCRKFDDSAIRAIDVLVDYAINNNLPSDYQINKELALSESKFLHLKLPRRSGKSTYLLALNRYLNNKQMGSSVLITRYLNKKLYPKECHNPIYSLEYFPGFNSTIPFVLYDEVSINDIKILGDRLTLSLYT